MNLESLLLLLVPMGVLSQRILGCRMPNGALNPSPNICNAAGGSFRQVKAGPGCCTNGREGPAVTEARFANGCNDNGGHIGSGEVLATSC
ncbi:secreted in xylem 14 [Fusarium tjaetaba]|uniref:Secreted in xylem 14 n=1 Tax=Fusarium tjaetaba TaxID=1567544 RepID=A0A8H5VTK2_9HYPO|nr:secreted in xylem 14 [Fusarium tjaetaba]KAF5633935.1 secreted in xylem 14 [Fusarium tjaetaba]